MRFGSVLVLAALVLGGSLTAHAANSPWTSRMAYGDRAMGKLTFGATNLLLGWTTLYRTPAADIRAGENPLGAVGRGVLNAIAQTGLGAAHVLTFPITVLDIPLPDNGTDVLGPREPAPTQAPASAVPALGPPSGDAPFPSR